jgi:protein-disulfide isomerase
MAKQSDGPAGGKRAGDQGRRRGSSANVVSGAKRGGPGRGFWIAAALVAVIGIGTLYWQTSQPKVTSRTIDPNLPKLKAEGYLMGSPNAPVEIIEFADFECPGCGQFATLTEPDVRTRLVNTGQVRFRFMDFPLQGHKNTWDAHLAASCANEQGKFWEMHDQIFANQDKWNGEATNRPRGPLGDLAKAVGLDMSKYNDCMEKETYRAQVQANLQEGERRMVNQTPTFIVGDKMFPGALPFDQFKLLVDSALKNAPAAAPTSDTGKKTQ